MNLIKKKINLNISFEDLVFSNKDKKIIFIITKEFLLLKINIESQEILFEATLDLEGFDLEKSIRLELSQDDDYIAVINDYSQFAYIYNFESTKVILKLDRKDYHSEQTMFPFAFLKKFDKDYIIHATDWNHLDITELSSFNCVTKRETNVYDKVNKNDLYLDYFYGEIHLSLDNKKILSSGWVWGPASVVKVIDIDKWFENKTEAELNIRMDIGIMSYYWDRAIAWINDNTIAYLYDPKEEGLDQEDLDELGIVGDKSYIVFYDINTLKSEFIEFDYPKNEYNEAFEDCQLFYDKYLYISSLENGIQVMDIESKKIIIEDKENYLYKYNKSFNFFYDFKEAEVFTYLK